MPHIFGYRWLVTLGAAACLTFAGPGCKPSGSTAKVAGDDSGGGTQEAQLRFVTKLSLAKYELPTGLALAADGKTAYLLYTVTGQVVSVDLASGQVTPVGSLAANMQNGLAGGQGLLLDGDGNIYIGARSDNPTKFAPGVYRLNKPVPGTLGVATLYATAPGLLNGNKMVFDGKGNLYFTDSNGGGIYKVPPGGGQASRWASDEVLNGQKDNPCHGKFPAAFGPAGITRTVTAQGEAIYVSNSDRASIVRVPVNADGSAGPAKVVGSGDPKTCLPLRGGDGLDSDQDGNVYDALNDNRIVRLRPDGTMDVVVEGGLLDLPTSVAVWNKDGQRYLLITNAALPPLRPSPTTPPPAPGLLVYGPLPKY